MELTKITVQNFLGARDVQVQLTEPGERRAFLFVQNGVLLAEAGLPC